MTTSELWSVCFQISSSHCCTMDWGEMMRVALVERGWRDGETRGEGEGKVSGLKERERGWRKR